MKTPKLYPITGSGSSRAAYRDRHDQLTVYERACGKTIAGIVRDSLKLPETHNYYYDHGYRSGELHESNLWQIAANVQNARPFSVLNEIEVPDFHIGILLDCSGSMCQYWEPTGVARSMRGAGRNETTTMTAARILCLGFANALNGRQGVNLSICGHTEESGNIHLIMAKRPRSEFKEGNIGWLSAQSGNLDGIALAAFAREMSREMSPGEPGMIVLISDGAPCHSARVMREAFQYCQKQNNISVFPVGVGGDLDDKTCTELYGSGNYVIARDVISATPNIVSMANSMIERLKPM